MCSDGTKVTNMLLFIAIFTKSVLNSHINIYIYIYSMSIRFNDVMASQLEVAHLSQQQQVCAAPKAGLNLVLLQGR